MVSLVSECLFGSVYVWYYSLISLKYILNGSEDSLPLGNIKHSHDDEGRKSSEMLKVLDLFQDYINSNFMTFLDAL